MFSKRSIRDTGFLVLICVVLSSCVGGTAHTPLLNSEPAADSTASREPRSLRLFFEALPDVPNSSVVLTGPAGEYQLRGMHSMGADDLMMEIYQPALVSGDYTVTWSTIVEGDPSVYEGTFGFSVNLD
ncbi:MAG: copper resistance protein CopC [Gammaproteobacteria bacterium]|nr:copper resistance protein CopC [Gammaproteobacteria bacterium]MBT3860295.1 copper resistance protein CopC [Gammaproteobacteria bacterium]MBT3987587.1 copper resistance protein CopC [Gammaproteobacteria bacterium]MBT4255921.1 copper resistance protein CopC [Gammaproteobacteria bacterium]MBT4581675.1 copper resistance protein CopC [Gammaproteobacteria bacterium]